MLTIKRHTFYRFVTVILIALICLGVFASTGVAQEPNLFEISLIPQSEYAVANASFEFTVIITNTSQDSLKDVVVTMPIPENTTFLATDYTNVNWFAGGVEQGGIGDFFWLTTEPVAPGEVIAFDLQIKVHNNSQQIVGENYLVTLRNDPDTIIATGPPVVTQVLQPTSTPTQLPTPTATSTTIPTTIVSAATSAQPVAKTNTPTPVTVALNRNNETTSVAVVQDTSSNTNSSVVNSLALVFLTVTILVAIVIMAGLFIKSR